MMIEKLRKMKTEDCLYILGWFGFLIIAPVALFILSNRKFPGQGSCVFYQLTGWYCPGCGGTRALYYFLTGHLLKSVWYHPLVPYFAVLYLGFMGTHMVEKVGDWYRNRLIGKGKEHIQIEKKNRIHGMRLRPGYIYAGLGILIVQFLIKNVLLHVFHYAML